MVKKEKELKVKARKFNDGLSFKLYSHFDRPYSLYYNAPLGNGKFKITEKTKELVEYKRKKILDLLKDEEEIAKHSFYPLIAYDIVERHSSKINKMKYDKAYYEIKIEKAQNNEEKHDFEEKLKESQINCVSKERPIRYAAHFDGFIYSYYAKKLTEAYEIKVEQYGLDNEILAYRKASQDETNHRHDNATMAKEVFDEIKRRNNNCVALAFDIKSFFDCIDHKKLKEEWCNVLNPEKPESPLLPDYYYNIYKSLTNYCYVDIKDICMYFKKYQKQKCQKNCEKCKRPKLPSLMFKKAKDFRSFRDWAKKQEATIFKKNLGLFKEENESKGRNYIDPYGIPQGSPMSALLSNIYMLPFDKAMKSLAGEINGHYRRYCDDIIFICNPEDKDIVENKIKLAIKERGNNLVIHDIIDKYKYSKSQCYNFTNEEEIKNRPLQYLGFEFDGEKIRIRKSSLARYYRKSKRAITATYLNAKKRLILLYKNNGLVIQNKHKKLYRKTLYSRYTHLGKRNFIYYAYRAFKSIEDTAIQSQIRTHFERINCLVESYDNEIHNFCQNLQKSKR